MESIFGENDPNVDQQTGQKDPSAEVIAQLKGGANWFYWIAGLSLVNSLIFAFGGDVNFIAGLAITQIIDAIANVSIAQGSSEYIRGASILLNLIVVAAFALIGYYANKAINAVFIGGMIVYLVDGLVWLLLDSIFAFGFHIFALIMIFRGFMASRELGRIEEHNAVVKS